MEKGIAKEIVSQMNADNRASFAREDWREGVEIMLVDEWAGADVEEVLDTIEAELAVVTLIGDIRESLSDGEVAYVYRNGTYEIGHPGCQPSGTKAVSLACIADHHQDTYDDLDDFFS